MEKITSIKDLDISPHEEKEEITVILQLLEIDDLPLARRSYPDDRGIVVLRIHY